MNSLTKTLIALLALILAITILSLLFGKKTEIEAEMAPDFELEALDGSKVKLSDFRGQVVILDFWATWCSPCRRQMGNLKELKKVVGDEVVILSIDVAESKQKVQSYVSKEEVDWIVLLDKKGDAARAYKVKAIPTIVIIDKEGRVREKFIGVTSAEALLTTIESIISG